MSDTEKITINMSIVDLGKIDLLVEDAFYSNRTDFIRTAIRNQLDRHDAEVKASIDRKTMAVGVVTFTQKGLERRRDAGETVSAAVVGVLAIEDDVSPELAQAVFSSIKVLGVFRANKAVKAALADRMR